MADCFSPASYPCGAGPAAAILHATEGTESTEWTLRDGDSQHRLCVLPRVLLAYATPESSVRRGGRKVSSRALQELRGGRAWPLRGRPIGDELDESQVAHDAGRVASHNDVRRHVIQDNAACPRVLFSPIVTPGPMTTFAAIQTFLPTVIGRAYSSPCSRSRGSTGWVAVEELYAGTEQAACPYRDRCAVENDAIDIDVCSGPQRDVPAIVAVERRFDYGIVPDVPKQAG